MIQVACRPAAWMVLVIGASGCCPGYVRVTLQAGADTNQGRPLRVIVRNVDEAQHRAESYAAIAALAIKPDASVIGQLTIDPRPGYSRSFWVKSGKDKPVGFYFLYTAPTASWKVWLQPELPWRITVPLGRAGVKAGDVSELRLLRKQGEGRF